MVLGLTRDDPLQHVGEPKIEVAAGVAEAAVLHVRSVIARLQLANQELPYGRKEVGSAATSTD